MIEGQTYVLVLGNKLAHIMSNGPHQEHLDWQVFCGAWAKNRQRPPSNMVRLEDDPCGRPICATCEKGRDSAINQRPYNQYGGGIPVTSGRLGTGKRKY